MSLINLSMGNFLQVNSIQEQNLKSIKLRHEERCVKLVLRDEEEEAASGSSCTVGLSKSRDQSLARISLKY